MALKTGTTNWVKDVSTYGFPPPTKNTVNVRALAVGVWMGNSDSSSTGFTSLEVFATDSAASSEVVHECLHQGVGRRTSGVPEGVVQARIDGFTGARRDAGPASRRREWFIRGTEPGSRGAVDEPGLLYDRRCGGWLVDLTNVGEPSGPDTSAGT